jgi:hypothetical protein
VQFQLEQQFQLGQHHGQHEQRLGIYEVGGAV